VLGKPVLFVDCQETRVREWCRSAPIVLGDLEGLLSGRVTLFFEEVQHLEEAGLFFKGLVDRRPGVPILITGSSSFRLRSRTRESLAGRASRTRLFPFSFEEVCWGTERTPDVARRLLIEDRLERHLVYGGYPEVWLSDSPETLLTDLVEAVILRDASDLFRIGRPDAFRRVLRLAASQAGNLVNLSEWASIAGVSRDTVASYVEILESSHILAAVPPFVGGRRAELTSTPKVYLVDNGIRNRLLHDFKPLFDRADKGPMFENWVFSELWKALPEGATLHFWRSASGAEVDFVLSRGDRTVAVEAKATAGSRAVLSRAARSFLQAYEPSHFLLVQQGVDRREKHGASEVRWVSPTRLASSVSESLAS
jgi:predicted AAA+ superfamily ATPase